MRALVNLAVGFCPLSPCDKGLAGPNTEQIAYHWQPNWSWDLIKALQVFCKAAEAIEGSSDSANRAKPCYSVLHFKKPALYII